MAKIAKKVRPQWQKLKGSEMKGWKRIIKVRRKQF